MFSLDKMSAQALYPVVTGLFFCFVLFCFNINLYELFIYFGCLSLFGHITCKYFFLLCRLSFCFIDGFLCSIKFLSLIRSHLFIFAFNSDK